MVLQQGLQRIELFVGPWRKTTDWEGSSHHRIIALQEQDLAHVLISHTSYFPVRCMHAACMVPGLCVCVLAAARHGIASLALLPADACMMWSVFVAVQRSQQQPAPRADSKGVWKLLQPPRAVCPSCKPCCVAISKTTS